MFESPSLKADGWPIFTPLKNFTYNETNKIKLFYAFYLNVLQFAFSVLVALLFPCLSLLAIMLLKSNNLVNYCST